MAFKTPTGQKVLIVQNNTAAPQAFRIRFQGKTLSSSLVPGAAGTYVW